MYNYKITLQYDGSRYDGWQRQGNTANTIQGRLEQLLTRLAGEPVPVQGAGRTDAGVHALGQVASFRLSRQCPPQELQAALNRYLPEDIAVMRVEQADSRFHARLSARGKIYRYALRLGLVPDVFRRKYQYRVRDPLDLQAMERAASLLAGTHDFRSFCGNRRFRRSAVRTLESIRLCPTGDDLDLWFRGDGFLFHMVRILTGTLLEVGMHRRAPEQMPAILAALDRSAAGPTAPAQGLTLMEVLYD